jgi:hypothetical protein
MKREPDSSSAMLWLERGGCFDQRGEDGPVFGAVVVTGE